MHRRSLEFYQQFRKLFGFMTTGTSREHLYGTVLLNAAKVSANNICDKRLSGEIRKLEMKNSRIDHSSSGHDDMVIAWMMANWFYLHAKNLDLYGVDVNKFHMRIGGDGVAATPEEIAERERSTAARVRIDDLAERLKNTDNVHLLMAIDSEIKRLSKDLNLDADIKTIDSLIKEAKQQRQSRLSKQRQNFRRAA